MTWESKHSQKRKNNWNLATWNVRNLFRAGLRNLTQELKRYNIMIAAIHKTRWQGSKIFDAGFMILKRVKDFMLNFEPVNKQC